jgi:hypothetical protein
MLHEYHVIYTIPYYPSFHITTVDLGIFYPWILGHYCNYITVYTACIHNSTFILYIHSIRYKVNNTIISPILYLVPHNWKYSQSVRLKYHIFSNLIRALFTVLEG